MTYREWSPGPELADRVACFWTSGLDPAAGSPGQSSSPASRARPPHPQSLPLPPMKRVLPDGCMDIIWGPDGVQVAGPDTHAHLVPVARDSAYVAVRFLPGGAGSVFGAPADAFTNLRLPLAELPGTRWHDGVPWPGQPQARDDLISFQAWITDRLCTPGSAPDPSVPAMWRALARGTPIPQVARDLGFSERTLRRRSLVAFGYGPKTLQRVLRFQQALHRARQGADLAWVAHRSGYADQAHLAGEVKDLAGIPLTRLL